MTLSLWTPFRLVGYLHRDLIVFHLPIDESKRERKSDLYGRLLHVRRGGSRRGSLGRPGGSEEEALRKSVPKFGAKIT